MSRHEAKSESPGRIALNWDRCPLCDGPVEQIKCKLVCIQCHAVIENCNGD